MPSCYGKVKRRAVFVHGAGGGAWEWMIWQRVFIAHGWNTQAHDLLPAEGGVARTHLHDYVQQVESWLQRDAVDRTRDASRAVLIGASLGGLIALLAYALAEWTACFCSARLRRMVDLNRIGEPLQATGAAGRAFRIDRATLTPSRAGDRSIMRR